MFTEPELTEEQKAVNEVKRFIYESNVAVKMLEGSLRFCFDMVWSNPNATPAKIFEVLGTQGAKTFSDSWEVQQLVKKLNPSFEYLVPPIPYTINEDGTVTITEAVNG
jgi:hypothetical protein